MGAALPEEPQDEQHDRDGDVEGPVDPELLRDQARRVAGLEVEKGRAEDGLLSARTMKKEGVRKWSCICMYVCTYVSLLEGNSGLAEVR